MIKKAAPAAVTLLLLGGLAYNADLKQLTNQFLSLSVWSLLGTFCLLFLNQYMSSVRFHLMLGSLGHKLKFKTSFYVNVYSMVGGVFLFNFFGQSLTHSLFLKEIDPTSTSSFMITAAERAISLSILLLLASASVLVIFPDFSVALTVDGWDGIKILVGLFVVVVFVLFGVLRSQMRRMLWGILS